MGMLAGVLLRRRLATVVTALRSKRATAVTTVQGRLATVVTIVRHGLATAVTMVRSKLPAAMTVRSRVAFGSAAGAAPALGTFECFRRGLME